MSNSQPEALTVSAVARRIGVAPATLRTWDRRYGLGPSDHNAGTHRIYSREDLLRLTYMRQMVMSGTSLQVAANMALAATLVELEQFCGQRTGVLRSNKSGSDIEMQRDESLVRELLHYADIMDETKFVMLIDREIETRGLETVWSNVMVPLLNEVGIMWEKSGSGIEIEHFVSESLSISLRKQVKAIENPINSRPVLIACVDGEVHSLPTVALVAVLSQRGIRAVSLGAQTPQQTLHDAIEKAAPPVIFLWAQMEQPANRLKNIIEALPNMRIKPRLILGGPGWGLFSMEGGFSNLRRSNSMDEAVALIGETFVG